jgi:NTE family protein
VLCNALAESAPANKRPTVGIALSGGSALGLAHIGVIRYFEEHHIPIDRVGGTSMGGLVGGLYAAGMDSSQITGVVEQVNWTDILNPSPPFKDQPIADKQKWNRTFGDLTLRFGRGFRLPSGLNSGAALSLELSRLTLPYANVNDFDQLPTPYRCVATDLVSGKAVVLDKGSLPVAMRATMSLPGIFTPVRLNQMVLVDGGVLENVPVDAVRHMGPDIVIAVALESPKPNSGQFKTMTGVLRQTISLAVAENEQRSLAKADLVIWVNTTQFSPTDYPKWRAIIEAGYHAAELHATELAQFELSPPEWEEYLTLRRSRMRPIEARGPVLAVRGATPSFEKNAREEIDRAIGSKSVTPAELERTLSGMVASTAVPGASYDWTQVTNGTEGYEVKFGAKPGDQVLARVSAQYTMSAGEPTRFGVKISTVTIPQSTYKERILATYSLGYDPGLQAEAYTPLGGRQYFIAPQLFIGRTHFNSYNGADIQTDFRDRFGGAFYAGVGTWRFAQLRLGARGGYDSYSRDYVVDGVASRNGGFATPEVRWIINNQNSGGLPSQGTQLEGASCYEFRDRENHPFFKNDFSSFQPLNHSLTLFALNHSATSFGRKLGYYDQFVAGDQTNMAAFRYQEFHANTLVTGGAGTIYHFHAIPHLSAHPGLALWYEAGRFDMGTRGWETHQSSSVGIFFPTQIGATGLQLSLDERGRARFRVMLGSF